jgi:Domain of unknown function (DUF4159)
MASSRRHAAALLAATLLVTAGYAYAQFGRGFGDLGFGEPVRFAPADLPDRRFTVCRIMYTSVRREPNGGGWRTDYPFGEINLMTRLSELTKTSVSFTSAHRPQQWVVRLTDDALFNCPYTIASDVGTIGITDEEARRLRLYLEKGGFLWVDDFWGSAAWTHWTRELGKALPFSEYPIEDVPLTDPIFNTQFNVTKVPQITNIQFWRGVGGSTTQERGADSPQAYFRAIRDRRDGRIMVAMTHNTDVADSWEREGEDPEYFYRFSPDGYALGINVLLYALTH